MAEPKKNPFAEDVEAHEAQRKAQQAGQPAAPGERPSPPTQGSNAFTADVEAQPKPQGTPNWKWIGPEDVTAGLRAFNNRFWLGDLADQYLGGHSAEEAKARGEKLAEEHPWSNATGAVGGETVKQLAVMRGLGGVIPWFKGAGLGPTMAAGGASSGGTSAVNQAVDFVKNPNVQQAAKTAASDLFTEPSLEPQPGAKPPGQMGLPDPKDVASRIAIDTGVGGLGAGIFRGLLPFGDPAARLGQVRTQPLAPAAQQSVRKAAEDAERAGVNVNLPQAMRLAGGEAERAAPAVQGLVANVEKSGPGSRVMQTHRVAQTQQAGAARAADEAGQGPATPYFRAAHPENLPATPSTTHYAQEAMDAVQMDDQLMAAIRRRAGLPPGAPVPQNNVAFRDAVQEQMQRMQSNPRYNPGELATDIRNQQGALRAGSPAYAGGAQTHEDFLRTLAEVNRGNPPTAIPPDMPATVANAVRSTPIGKVGGIFEYPSSKYTARALTDPSRVGQIGLQSPRQPLGQIGGATADVGQEEYEKKKRRRPGMR